MKRNLFDELRAVGCGEVRTASIAYERANYVQVLDSYSSPAGVMR